jgi:hypothetical protein
MKELNLPEPIAAYFDADRQDAQAVARCFTKDGLVLDEGKTHTGLAAIEAWKADSTSRYIYAATPHTLEKQDRAYVVTAKVAGSFPGSPVDLRYSFTLERGKVATLEIAP